MINKMQKEYLERRLMDIKTKQIKLFLEKNPTELSKKQMFDILKNGEAVFKKWEDVKSCYSLNVADVLDLSSYDKIFKKNRDKLEDLENKLKYEALEIMDKVMFEGLSIEDAIKNFDKK
jgi:predicted nucleic acid-binding protein